MRSDAALVGVDVAAWVGLSVVVGVAAGHIPTERLESDTWLTRIRPWEDNGRLYQRWLHIRRWKDRLPESNGLGPGERPSKSSVRTRADVSALVVETRRAEYVHWVLAASGLLFWLWNPPWLAAIMTAFGLVMNAPFIAVQRFNRARARRAIAGRRSPECPR